MTGSGRGRRLLGVEDGSFEAFSESSISTYLCGVVWDSGVIRDVRLSEISVDGLDATDRLLEIMDGLDLDAVILGGITFAGFNIIDPFRVFDEIMVPLIVYSGVKPDNESMYQALKKNFVDWEARWSIVERLGDVHETVSLQGEPKIYFEVVGCTLSWAEEVLRSAALISRIPEPVRAAGIIARGLSPAC